MCGIFGIYRNVDAAANTALGLHALQHRGQEAAGIVSFNGERFFAHRDMGLVGEIFGDEEIIRALPGYAAIGHNRYSTSGETVARNTQPLFAHMDFGGFAVAHNGNLTNSMTLRKELVREGRIFQSTSDTEVIIHLIAKSRESTFKDRLIWALKKVIGAYCLVMLIDDKMIAVRDPYGVRPLSLGKLGEAYIVASESVAFDIIGAEFVRDIEPGEMLFIGNDGLESSFPFEKVNKRLDIFEYIYFSRPDSIVDGRSVYEARINIGRKLAEESHVDADVVVSVPDSGNPSAMGYAREANLPFEMGIIRNHYIGRTFIEPTDKIRHLGVKLKHNASRKCLEGKRVVLVDDSIVRGTTSRKIVEMVRAAGAKEIHFRVSSPPKTWPCFYGIDTPDRSKLIAANHTVEEVEKLIGVDSLKYISLDGLYQAMGEKGRNNDAPQFEDSVFTGDYPIPLVDVNGGNHSRDNISLIRETT